MSAPASASKFLAALKAEGLSVVEVSNWASHNRNGAGPWGPVHGTVLHHTVTRGTASTVAICRNGYAGLPGPLCNGVIAKDGRVHLVGYGRTNHAGSGDDDVLAAVIAESYGDRPPAPNEANTDGNRHFHGFECENMGDGKDPWPDAQVEAMVRASAAVCRLYSTAGSKWTGKSVIGHLEWQPGKPDPRGVSMVGLRRRIDERLAHAASWTRPTTPAPPKPPAAKTVEQRLTALEKDVAALKKG